MKPPANPTWVEKTPRVFQKSCSAPQKHPIPVGGTGRKGERGWRVEQGSSSCKDASFPGTEEITHQKSPSASVPGMAELWGSQ